MSHNTLVGVARVINGACSNTPIESTFFTIDYMLQQADREHVRYDRLHPRSTTSSLHQSIRPYGDVKEAFPAGSHLLWHTTECASRAQCGNSGVPTRGGDTVGDSSTWLVRSRTAVRLLNPETVQNQSSCTRSPRET